MNDAAVMEIWRRLETVEDRLDRLERHLTLVEGQIRARLKEEADAREGVYQAPRHV